MLIIKIIFTAEKSLGIKFQGIFLKSLKSASKWYATTRLKRTRQNIFQPAQNIQPSIQVEITRLNHNKKIDAKNKEKNGNKINKPSAKHPISIFIHEAHQKKTHGHSRCAIIRKVNANKNSADKRSEFFSASKSEVSIAGSQKPISTRYSIRKLNIQITLRYTEIHSKLGETSNNQLN